MSDAGYLIAGMGMGIADRLTRAYQENQRLRLQAALEQSRERRGDARYDKRYRQRMADQLRMNDVKNGAMVRAEDFKASPEDIASAYQAQHGLAPGAKVPGPDGGMVSDPLTPTTRDVGLTPATTEWAGEQWVRPTERQRLAKRMAGLLAEGAESGAKKVGESRYLEKAGYGKREPLSYEDKLKLKAKYDESALRRQAAITSENKARTVIEPRIGKELKDKDVYGYTEGGKTYGGVRDYLPEYNAYRRRNGLPELELVKKRNFSMFGPPAGLAAMGVGSYWVLQEVNSGTPQVGDSGQEKEIPVVRLSDGAEGTIPANEWDETIYKRLDIGE